MSAPPPPMPQLAYDPTSSLPLGQLDSLRFKISQIIESIQNLQLLLHYGTGHGMLLPPWPDIIAKYNILVSQTHTLSISLAGAFAQQSVKTTGVEPSNPFEKIALHPFASLPDSQLDNDLIPLLRNQQTIQVLNYESSLVARLRNSPLVSKGGGKDDSHEVMIKKCATMKEEHDARADRAIRAVGMLRDKFEIKRADVDFPRTPSPVVPVVPMTVDEEQDEGDDEGEGEVEGEGEEGSGSSDSEQQQQQELENMGALLDEAQEAGDNGSNSTPQSGMFTPTS